MFRKFVIITVFIVFLPSHSFSSNNIPMDNWIYIALDRLFAFNLIETGLRGTRPYTRVEAARLVNEAAMNRDRMNPREKALAEYFLRQLEWEFREELSEHYKFSKRSPKIYLKPLRDLKIAFNKSHGNSTPYVHINKANQFPLIYNNGGVKYPEHNNISLEFSTEVKVLKHLSFYFHPLFEYKQNIHNKEDKSARFHKIYAKFNFLNTELEIGRDSLWWGQGRHGSLILTDNAWPLDMIKISNPVPFLLPWYFSYLGPFKYTFFVSELEKDRIVPEVKLGGFRINFKPHPGLEVGLSRVAMIGGKGRPDIGGNEIFSIIFGENITNVDEDTSNQIAAIDFRYKVPLQWKVFDQAELYGEWGGEDEAGGLPTKAAYIIGIYLPKITGDGRTDLLVEYARTHKLWYSHRIYHSGYSYKSNILGHHMGGDASDIYFQIGRYINKRLRVEFEFDYEKRGRSLDNPMKIYQYGLNVKYDYWDNLRLLLSYKYGKVDNFNFSSGSDKKNHLYSLEINYNF
ncbi:MAG: capsule assembly Wzi family protein [Thermodesulfobacteriota bacterium]|nr:capsule assembly Wzi family protein [Thermodesulfobacteriota bacterium]